MGVQLTKQAIDLYHPALAKIGIHSVVCESIGPETPEGKGLWSITIELLEYLPAPKVNITSTPTGSTAKGSGKAGTTGKGDDPIADAHQAEIKKLIAEAQA